MSVRLVRAQRQLRLEVTDDGQGMPTGPDRLARRRVTLGMRAMGERAAALGGRVVIIVGARVGAPASIAILPIPPAGSA